MTYQISEKNQILIALFAIVVLCAGKLFKDYLFRRGYVEGFITSAQPNVRLVRPYAGANALLFNIYFRIKMPAAATVITVELPANTGHITLESSNANIYTLKTVANDMTTADITNLTKTYSDSGTRKIEFTRQTAISKDDIIQIGIPGSLTGKTQSTTEIFGPFKVIIGSFNASESITISPNTGADAFSGANSAQALQNAITTIDARLTDLYDDGDPRRAALLDAKSALVTVMAYTYGTVKDAGKVFDSDALYNAQITAMDFIKKEKERAASNATALKEDNSNKRRMAQINTYYTRNYEANTEVMKNIIFISVALIILAILRNKELIPDSISTLGIIFVLMLGGVVIGSQVFDIIRRNDHDFDKYDWTFNEKEQNDKKFIQTDTANLSELGMGMAPCFGSSCCASGTRWDETAKKCIPLTGSVSGTARWTAEAGGTLTIRLTVPTALVVDDTITINLPSGLFSGRPAALSGAFIGSPSLSAPFNLTVKANGVSDSTTKIVPNIVITGLSVTPGASALMKDLTVKTSKDINYVRIGITGI